MMRTWLYNRLVAILGASWPVQSSGAADSPTRPFAVLRMGVEASYLGLPAEMGASTVPFAVNLHDEPGSMLMIDGAATLLKSQLPTQDGFVVGGVSVFEIRWSEVGEDGFDDHWGTIFRPVRFSLVLAK